MTLEQQISSINENIGNLIVATEQLTNKVENKLQEYEIWKGTLNKSNPVVLKVGSDKEFQHPVDAAIHIANHGLAGDVIWRIEIDPGIYDFPYHGIHELGFSFYKNVQIIGLSGNPSDTIFRYVGDNHRWMVYADKHSCIEIRNIGFKGSNPITPTFINQINNRILRDGMAGAGLAHGILVKYNSSGYVTNCSFNRLWHALHCHDNSKLDINNVNGSEIYGGAHAVANSRIEITRSTFTGIDRAGQWASTSWAGLGAFHNSEVFANGMTIRNFNAGLYCHWGSDFHLHKAFDYADDGITEINIKNSLIEDCYHGVHTWHKSDGNINNLLTRNIESYAIVCGQTSNVHAAYNVTVDGADIGFYVVHGSGLVANDSTARNCRNVAYYSANKSELHAINTSKNLSLNAINYSPNASSVLGNTDSLIYFS